MTHDNDTRRATTEGLERLLDTYGADRSRWPARERLRYSAHAVENAEARRLVAEAEAFDRLLDLAADSGTGSLDALTARIMASAIASGAEARGTAGHPDGQERAVVPMRPRVRATKPGFHANDLGWPAAVLLAASVMIGVFVGTSGVGLSPAEPMSASVEADGDWDASLLAWGSDEADPFDVEEETL